MKKTNRTFFGRILLVVLIGLLLTGCSFFGFGSGSTSNSSSGNITYGANENVTILESTSNYTPSTIEEAIGLVYDSVVAIYSSNKQSTSSGSGVIIGQGDEYYYIITCHHVIDGYNDITIMLSNNDLYNAEIVGGDEASDIAVLRIKANNLSVAKFISDSSNVTIGSTAIVIGNPLGTLSGSVTTGIISSASRLIQMDDGTSKDLIQTDAAINSGNSGGGLFNIYGELIGIVNAKYAATGVEGLGFAIPANTAKSIASGLIEKGYVEGRYNLGFTVSDGYIRSGGFFGSVTKVVYISSVEENSSSYGILEVEDIVYGIRVEYKDSSKENSELTSFSVAQDITNFLNGLDLEIGDKIILTIKRGSSSNKQEVTVELKQYVYQ